MGPVIIKRPPPGSEPKYGAILEAVEHVWTAAEQLCGKRLVQGLPLWLPHYERHERHNGKLLPCQRKLIDRVRAANSKVQRPSFSTAALVLSGS